MEPVQISAANRFRNGSQKTIPDSRYSNQPVCGLLDDANDFSVMMLFAVVCWQFALFLVSASAFRTFSSPLRSLQLSAANIRSWSPDQEKDFLVNKLDLPAEHQLVRHNWCGLRLFEKKDSLSRYSLDPEKALGIKTSVELAAAKSVYIRTNKDSPARLHIFHSQKDVHDYLSQIWCTGLVTEDAKCEFMNWNDLEDGATYTQGYVNYRKWKGDKWWYDSIAANWDRYLNR